jgi:hypothetical protein
MSKIQAQAVQVEVYATEDGKTFKTLEAAERHQARIDAGEFLSEVIPDDVQAYINANGLTGRAVAQANNAIGRFRKFLETWDGEEVPFNQEAADEYAAKVAGRKTESSEANDEEAETEADNDLL